jgi:hypothetical protein
VVSRRQRRAQRLELGESLALFGLTVLVVTPIVYRIQSAVGGWPQRRALLWPTAWMFVPLIVFVIGLAVIFSTSNRIRTRRR